MGLAKANAFGLADYTRPARNCSRATPVTTLHRLPSDVYDVSIVGARRRYCNAPDHCTGEVNILSHRPHLKGGFEIEP